MLNVIWSELTQLFELIKSHPVISVALTALAFAFFAHYSEFTKQLAKRNVDHFFSRLGRKANEPTVSPKENADAPLGDAHRGLSSADLTSLYGDENYPFQVTIGENEWKFPACRELAPSGSGAVDEQMIFFRYVHEWFVLDKELDAITQPRLEEILKGDSEKRLFNGDPFRIRKISHAGEFTEIEVGRCKYFDSLRTNFSLDHPVRGRNKTLREILHPKGERFRPLGEDRLPNHIGLVVIVETLDGQILIQKRSAKVSNRPDTLSASVSGTFEKADLGFGSSERISFERAMFGVIRELHGELGGVFDLDPSGFFFLGLMREFERGGFPDFYFYFQSPHSLRRICSEAREAEESFEIDGLLGYFVGGRLLLEGADHDRDQFDERIVGLLRELEAKGNLTIKLGIGLYYEMILRRFAGASKRSA